MLAYIGRRLGFMLVLLVLLSVVSFILIQLPPGDYLTTLVARRQLAGGEMTQAERDALQQMYGLGLPLHRQYLKWAGNLLRGDLGRSFQWNRPVSGLVAERLPLTLVISAAALLFTLPDGDSDRHLLRHPSVLLRRLHVHRGGLRGPGHPAVSARPDPDVPVLQGVRHEHRGPVLARVHGCALELGQVRRPAENTCQFPS